MSGFSLRYFQPATILKEWITVYYCFQCDLPELQDTIRAELPQVRFAWRGTCTSSMGGLPHIPMPQASLCGPSNTAIHFHALGPYYMFGAGLRPTGWAALIGAGANEMADLPLDLEQVVGPIAKRTLAQMAEAECDRERIAAMDAFFLSLAMRARQPPLWFTRVTDAWLRGSTNPDVNELIQSLGMSSRQVERLALRIYGGSPKLLARKSRAVQAAIKLGHTPDAGWENASAGAYYDQPHFIRDFKSFIGMTPGDYLERGAASLIQVTVNEP